MSIGTDIDRAAWTRDDGLVFLPVCDPEGIGLDPIRYRKPEGKFSSEMRLTSSTWSWADPVTLPEGDEGRWTSGR